MARASREPRPATPPSDAQLSVAVLTPSRFETALTSALMSAAAACGWTCLGAGASAASAKGATLVICPDSPAGDLPPGARIVVVAGEVETAAGEAATLYGLGPEMALVVASRRLAQAAEAAGRPGAWVVPDAELAHDRAAGLARLISALGLKLAPAAMKPIAEAFARAVSNAAPRLDCGGALNAFAELPPPAGAASRWGPELFWRGDQPDQRCDTPIDVTGGVRVLAFGPYLSLSPGLWRATVSFDLCEDAARRPYRIEFATGATMAHVTVQAQGSGRQVVAVEHAVPTAQPAEVRIVLPRAAFHGALIHHGAVIEHLGPTPANSEASP